MASFVVVVGGGGGGLFVFLGGREGLVCSFKKIVFWMENL